MQVAGSKREQEAEQQEGAIGRVEAIHARRPPQDAMQPPSGPAEVSSALSFFGAGWASSEAEVARFAGRSASSAAAGVWRDSDEWGRCYSMVMTEAAGPAADCHDRMPVILAPDDYGTWTSSDVEAARGRDGAQA